MNHEESLLEQLTKHRAVLKVFSLCMQENVFCNDFKENGIGYFVITTTVL